MTVYNPEDYWDNRAMTYDQLTFQNLRERDEICNFYKDNLPKSILEVGPGAGRIYLALIESGLYNANYSAVDISDRMRGRMMTNTGRFPGKWDGVTLPYVDGKFDMVVSFNVLLHVPPGEIQNHLQELVRVCNKWVYIATWEGTGCNADHCFSHNYHELLCNLKEVEIRGEIRFDDDRVHYILEKIE